VETAFPIFKVSRLVSQQTKSTCGNSVGSRILPFPRASVAC